MTGKNTCCLAWHPALSKEEKAELQSHQHLSQNENSSYNCVTA